MEGKKMHSCRVAALATNSSGSNHVDDNDDDDAFVCLMYISSRVLVLVFIQYLFAEDNRCRTVRRIFIDRKVNQSPSLSRSLARAHIRCIKLKLQINSERKTRRSEEDDDDDDVDDAALRHHSRACLSIDFLFE